MIKIAKSFWFSLFIGLFPASLFAQEFSIITEENHPLKGCVQLMNPSIGDTVKYQNKDLQVFLFPENPDKPTAPIIGSRKRIDNQLYFCPLIPFSKNLTYQAQFPEVPYFTFKPIPPKNYTQTTITKVYPTLDTLPENTLKVYLHFSAPMSDGNAYQHIILKEEKGEKIAVPFLELTPLLWNEDRTRLTLWFDPGRVKRELLRNQKLGAPLTAGKNYTLHISKNWKDANGYSLGNDFIKNIHIIAADRREPNTKEWSTTLPKANTKTPVIIHFGEALDHALVQKSLTVFNTKGKKVAGEIMVGNNEKEWLFTPTNNWEAKPYRIQIKSELEDLAGNNFNRLFDTNLEKQNLPKRDLPYYYFDFTVK